MRRSLASCSRASLAALVGFASLAGCSAASSSTDESEFSSNQATLLDFEFEAELVTDWSVNERQTIEGQLLYTIGHLNHDRSVGRLDDVHIEILDTSTADGKTTIKYKAKLPVAWGRKSGLPTTYALSLPRDVSMSGLNAFTEAHARSCVDWGAHDVDSGSMWYYYRPQRSGCRITDAEVFKTTATVTPSALNTTGKYPELHKVWEDDRLEVVAIFGKYKDGATSAGDGGISAYNAFVASMKRKFASLTDAKSTPAELPSAPGVEVPDVTFEGLLPDGKVLQVVALLVDDVSDAPAAFYERYEQLSPSADLIAYNGHAGLGQNVRALARKGRFVSGKYQIFFMNGCDTFAYVDGSLAETRAALNPDDPTGTKYMEFVTNAMPSFFSSMSAGSATMIDGLLSFERPKTYDEIFEDIDDAEVVLVTGEEDNVFTPGMPTGSSGGAGVHGQ